MHKSLESHLEQVKQQGQQIIDLFGSPEQTFTAPQIFIAEYERSGFKVRTRYSMLADSGLSTEPTPELALDVHPQPPDSIYTVESNSLGRIIAGYEKQFHFPTSVNQEAYNAMQQFKADLNEFFSLHNYLHDQGYTFHLYSDTDKPRLTYSKDLQDNNSLAQLADHEFFNQLR